LDTLPVVPSQENRIWFLGRVGTTEVARIDDLAMQERALPLWSSCEKVDHVVVSLWPKAPFENIKGTVVEAVDEETCGRSVKIYQLWRNS